MAGLREDEAAELGPLLRRASSVVDKLVDADQVYNCLCSHAGGVPVHLHFVVQPVTKALMSAFEAHGPSLQVAMFSAGDQLDPDEIEDVAARARILFAVPTTPVTGPNGTV
jgi:diadenosine tetraphosphate (Ap4A) HIT family hydrolase